MAEGFEQDRRGLFDGLQVPQSLTAILIAAAGLIIYWLGITAIESSHSGIPGDGHCRLIGGMLGNVTVRLGTPGALLARWGGWANDATHYDLLVWVLFIGWSSMVWAFFAGAINRVAAMKLAREEAPEAREVLRFAARKFLPNLLSIGFVLVIVGFFYLVCNATVAGWIGSIPVAGDVLLGVFYFLVLISSFLVVFATILGTFGFNLASAAIATESSDTFDGVSRAWNYILARPWTVLLAKLAMFLYIVVVLFCGQWFIKVSVKSLSVGFWGLGHGEERVEVDQEVIELLGLAKTTRLRSVIVPAKGEYLYQRIIHGNLEPEGDPDNEKIRYRQGFEYALERHRANTGAYPESLERLITPPRDNAETWLGPYLAPQYTRVPKDPWGRELVYERILAPEGETYRLFSAGQDGTPGTGDDLQHRELDELYPRCGPAINIKPLLHEGTRGFLFGAVYFWVMFFARTLLYAYVVAYFFCAQTTLYFFLRKDVEGDDYSEIVLQEPSDRFSQPTGPAPAPAKSDDEPGGGKELPTV